MTKGSFGAKLPQEKFTKGGAIGKKNAKISLDIMRMVWLPNFKAAESTTSEMTFLFGSESSFKFTFYNAAVEDTRQSLELLAK